MRKRLTEKIITDIENEVILLLLECIRQEEEKKNYLWNTNNAYYAEAFGIMRGMVVLNYCYFGANNNPAEKQNAKWWFDHCQSIAEKEKEELEVKDALQKYSKLCMKLERYRQ